MKKSETKQFKESSACSLHATTDQEINGPGASSTSRRRNAQETEMEASAAGFLTVGLVGAMGMVQEKCRVLGEVGDGLRTLRHALGRWQHRGRP